MNRKVSLLLGFIALSLAASPNYEAAARELNWALVQQDVLRVFNASQSQWPADYGHYGPFFIRLAWHCAGSYRASDGRGGCAGGRQRFEPERSWADNTNLDKARALLEPVKLKYGDGLSWGDLIIFTGTLAIQQMGGPTLGFCAGRPDDEDGSQSILLGPNEEQAEFFPCAVDGDCKAPLGSTTLGLIYVNPEGPMGRPDPAGSAPQIRDTFGRMSMNDTETVALIGGGHTFGKTHGACPTGPGPSPKEDPLNPWPGTCGEAPHALTNAFTSGFEGPWTRNPVKWDGDYWTLLTEQPWKVTKGPGGHFQWRSQGINGTNAPKAPAADFRGSQDVMMLTSDISLLYDAAFSKEVAAFKASPDYFANQFQHAWYKLTTRDMGPVERCLDTGLPNLRLPPAQPFQLPLPPAPAGADVGAVKALLLEYLTVDQSTILKGDTLNGGVYYGAIFSRLAFQCAHSFRVTDHAGGCNGARIRFLPQSNWPENKGWADKAVSLLQPIKDHFGDALSWADLITLAGQVAIEDASGLRLKFCAGRADALDGTGIDNLAPPAPRGSATDFSASSFELSDEAFRLGLSKQEFVSLFAQMRSAEIQQILGRSGGWTTNFDQLDNTYFRVLLDNTWDFNGKDFQARGRSNVFMTRQDVALAVTPDFQAIVTDFYGDNDGFLETFARAWTKLANADRFSGPQSNKCAVAH